MVQDQTHYAKVAALSIAHASALVKLLRAHGRDSHAANVEAALDEFVEIVSGEVGPQVLARAMNRVSDAAWGPSGGPVEDPTQH